MEKKTNTKKILSIVGIIILAVLLINGSCACIGFSLLCSAAESGNREHTYPFIHETDSFDDVKIELVTVEWNGYDSEQKKYIGSITVIKGISDREVFLEEFRALGFTFPFEPCYDLNSGRGICFTYPDGQVEVVTGGGCGLFTDRSLEECVRFNGRFSKDVDSFWEKWLQE